MFDKTFEGFASANNETMEMLTKALSAGTGVDAGSFSGGRALTPESMDFTLVNILHTQDEARLFQRLKKQPIKSVIHQWNVRDDVGDDDGAWVPEGGDSQEKNQNVTRKYLTVTVKDPYGNVATGYRGTVRFTSSDSAAVLPGNYTFTAGDAGVHVFSATLKTASSSTSITVTDTTTTSITGTQTPIIVE